MDAGFDRRDTHAKCIGDVLEWIAGPHVQHQGDAVHVWNVFQRGSYWLGVVDLRLVRREMRRQIVQQRHHSDTSPAAEMVDRKSVV